MDPGQLKQLKQKVEEELRQRELAIVEYWLTELKNLEAKRHRDLASLQADLKGLIERLATRQRRLKGGSP
uniref:Uncharacterized protein n=1 Tax=Desulfobacca acetoxidans TaxID=60893 RepID=A0A7V4G850_9BACT